MTPSTPLIDEATASFIQGGVSIIVASADPQNLPTIARAVGCRVSPDRSTVTLLVPPFEPFGAAVHATGTIAATFTQPSTHKAIQLKGADARSTRRIKNDLLILATYADAFAADVCPLGYSEELIRAMVWCEPTGVSAIAFSPTAAFQQTPGPRAGSPLRDDG